MAHALVVGVSGLVGSHVARGLRSAGVRVRGVSRAVSVLAEEACDEFIPTDLLAHGACEAALAGVEDVYFFAANSGGQGYVSKVKATVVQDNLLMLIHILEALQNRPVKRLLFASSAWAGAAERCLSGSHEMAIPQGVRPYALQKLLAEELCQAAASAADFECKIVRLHNIFGVGAPFEGGREGAVMALCRDIARASEGDTIRIRAAASDQRSHMAADSCAEAIIRTMSADIKAPLEVGTPGGIRFDDLAIALAKLAQKRLVFEYAADSTYSRVCDADPMARALNWLPPKDIDVELAQSYSWVRNQLEARGDI